MNKKKKLSAILPLSWRIWSWLGAIPLACGIFALFYFRISRIGMPNPYHPFDPVETAGFGLVFGACGALAIKFLVIDRILAGKVQKQTAGSVAKDIARDVTEAVVIGVIDAATGSSSSSSGSSSSRSGMKGGGGNFGGGGASGGY
jgi:uncharacterized membrane protein YgcG